MKIFACFFVSALLYCGSVCAQTFQWVQAGLSNDFDSQVNGLSASGESVTAVGSFAGRLSFGNQSISSIGSTTNNALVSQWSSSGEIRWLQRSGSPLASTGYHDISGKRISSDAVGNSYAAHFIFADALFGQTLVQIPSNGQAIVLVKRDKEGVILWVQAIKTTSAISLGNLTVDVGGKCWIAASFSGQLTVGTTQLSSSRSNPSTPDGVLIRFNDDGSVLLTRQITASSGDIFTAITADKVGNIYVAGHFNTSINLGLGQEIFGSGDRHLFLAKYDTNGTCLWARSMGGPDNDIITSLATDTENNIIGCGSFGNTGSGVGNSTAIFDKTSVTTMGQQGFPDGFVVKYDTEGIFKWVQSIKGGADESCDAVTTGVRGVVYVSGRANDGTTIGVLSIKTGGGSTEGFVTKFNSDGIVQWLTSYGGSRNDNFAGFAIANDYNGHIYVGGSFYGLAQFDNYFASGYANCEVPFIAQIIDNQTMPLSTKDLGQTQIAMQVYPNPATDIVFIKWPNNLIPIGIELFDIMGKNVLHYPANSTDNGKLLNLNELSSGIYLIKLTTTTGVLSKKVIIK